MIRHNRKSIQAYDNKFHIITTSQTSSLNIAIKNGKQRIIPMTNRRRLNILGRNHLEYSKSKSGKTNKIVTYT